MEENKDRAVEAGQRAIEKLIEEHRRSGEPMVIAPTPSLIQWVVPQEDGSMKVVREKIIAPRH